MPVNRHKTYNYGCSNFFFFLLFFCCCFHSFVFLDIEKFVGPFNTDLHIYLYIIYTTYLRYVRYVSVSVCIPAINIINYGGKEEVTFTGREKFLIKENIINVQKFMRSSFESFWILVYIVFYGPFFFSFFFLCFISFSVSETRESAKICARKYCCSFFFFFCFLFFAC